MNYLHVLWMEPKNTELVLSNDVSIDSTFNLLINRKKTSNRVVM